MWLQLWSLPVHWLTREVGRKIGLVIGKVEDVIISIGKQKWETFEAKSRS